MTSRTLVAVCFVVAILALPDIKAQEGDCDSLVADLVFVVDANADVLSALDFMTKIVKSVKIKDDAVKVALITYGETVEVEIRLDEYSNEGDVIGNLGVSVTPGAQIENRRLDLALRALKTDIFAAGKGNRDDVGDIVIVLTDGPSGNPSDTMAALAEIKDEKYTIFTIGVGEADSDELDAIASDPSSIFSLRIASFGNLDENSEAFTLDLCEAFLLVDVASAAGASCEAFKADVIFALDSSHSVIEVNFKKMLDFVAKIIESMAIGEDDVRVGLFTYSDAAETKFALGEHTNKDDLLAAVKAIVFKGGLTNTHLALDYLKSDMYASSQNRVDVEDIVIFLSDGKSTKPDETTAALGRIQSEGYTIFTLGIGDKIDKVELNAISSDPDSTYSVEVDGFDDLKGIRDAFASQICDETFEPSCDEERADIILVVDSSGSIKRHNFEKMKKFLIGLIKEFKVSSDGVRVGLLGFAKETTVEFYLDTHSSKGAVLAGISNMKYTRGRTYTDKALKRLREEMLVGNGNRDDVKDIVIFVSDGKSTEPEDTKAEVVNLKKEDYTVFAIGIGENVDIDELNSISSDPDPFFTSLVKDFDGLEEIKKAFTRKACEVDPPKEKCQSKADVAIIMDASSSIGNTNFVKMRKFVKDLIGSFSVDSDNVQISLIVFNSDAYIEFSFNKYDNVEDMLTAVDNSHDISSGTFTHLALKKTREEIFTKDSGRRDDVPGIVILLTDGQSKQPAMTDTEAEKLRKLSVTILVLGIGGNVDESELKIIASDPDDTNVQRAADFDALSGVLENLVEVTCEVIKNTPEEKCQSKADVAIIMDASSSIGNTDFVKMRKFVKDLIGSFSVGSDNVQISLIVFNSDAYIEFSFNKYDNVEEMLTAVDNSHDISSGTYTHLALKKTREEIFTKASGRRDDVPGIVILLTDGQSKKPAMTDTEADKLRKLSVTILVLGIGGNVDESELKIIASDPDDTNVQRAADFDALSGVLENLVEVTCEVIEHPPKEKCQSKADVAIIMDASSSIGNTNFVKMRKFVKDLIGSFSVGSDNVQISLIVFNSDAYIEFSFNKYDNVEEMLTAVDNSHDISSGTYTHLALKKTSEEIFTKASGRRDDVPGIAILLTDGRSKEPAMTDAEAEKLRKLGVTILVLGIGGNVDESELKIIASAPDDTNVQRAADFDALSGVLENLVEVTCEVIENTDPPEEHCGATGDLVFVVDISTSIGASNILKIKNLIKDIFNGLEISGEKIRFSVVTYDILPKVLHDLTGDQSIDGLQNALDKISDLGYGSWIDRAFHLIRSEVLGAGGGERPQSNDVIVVFSDGLARDADKAIEEAEKLKENGAKIITVGIEGYNRGTLRSLSSGPSDDYSFTVDDFSGMQQIRRLLTDKRCPSLTHCGVEADIVVVMDASTSIDKEEFEKMKEFVKHLLSGFEIGPDRVRVGLTTFNYDAVMEFQLKSFATKRQVLRAVDALSGRGAQTRTDKALKIVREVMFTEDNGNRPEVPDIVIVLTDGRSRNKEDTAKEALELHKEGIRVFAIGIGKSISEKELMAIASSASDVYEVDTFEGLPGIEASLKRKTCGVMPSDMGKGLKLQADIIFAFDSSHKVSESIFEKTIDMAKHIVKSVHVSKRWTRFGAVKFSSDAVLEMTLDSYFNRADILMALDQIEHNGGECRVEKALRQLRTLAFKECLGGRADVPDVAIVFTSGTFEQVDAARYEALLARNAGIKIYAVGIGQDADKFQLEILSSSPYSNTVFVGETKDELMALFNQLLFELDSGLNVCY